MTALHVVLPGDIDDPATPSGGNSYDRRVLDGLTERGWTVTELPVAGDWPAADAVALKNLAEVVGALPDGASVLVDGLVAAGGAEALLPQVPRLRLALLVHMVFGVDREQEVLQAAGTIVTTSEWTRDLLVAEHGIPADRVHAAPPGVDPAPPVSGSPTGAALLSVGAVSRAKGHDVLTAALASLTDLPVRATYVGSLDRDPEFVAGLRGDQRIRLTGPLTAADLAAEYAAADLLVLASRGETYGMVVTEALARGIPVIATAVGGVPEALGRTPTGDLPGILVPPGDPAALATALRAWLTDPDLRQWLRTTAAFRRDSLSAWSVTVEKVGHALRGAVA